MNDIRSLLVGTWRLSRTITGRHAMTGTASFGPRPDGSLHYHEGGSASFGGSARPLAFSQSYLYRIREGALRVLFDEPVPRLFQDVPLQEDSSGWRGQGRHLCAPDTYISSYEFGRAGQFSIRHMVTGPRKSYLIETLFTRDHARPAEPGDIAC